MVFSQILKYWRLSSGKNYKADKDFAKKRDFKDIQFPVKIKDIHKIEKQNFIGISVFDYENKEKHPIDVSKNIVKVNLLIYYW